MNIVLVNINRTINISDVRIFYFLKRLINFDTFVNMVDEEPCKRINLKENEFGGLIGNFAGQFLRDRVGDGFAGQLIGNIFGGGDNRQSGQG